MSRRLRVRRAAAPFLAAAVALGVMVAGPGVRAESPFGTNRHPSFPSLVGGHPRGLSLGLFGGRPIKYHGGPVMLGTSHAYAIWYGNWPNAGPGSTPALMASFMSNVAPSPYFNINTTYNNGTTAVSNSVAYGGSAFIGYDNGKTTLSDADVESEVAKTIAAGKLPNLTTPAANTVADPSGVYFLLTSSDVRESSGFLFLYCGWHDFATVGSVATKYAFVGDPSRSLSSCAGQTASSPNTNVAGDAMVNIVAHELEEAVTDPLLSAWYDNGGQENADKCAWNFGPSYTTANGSKANMRLGDGKDYYIQQNWLNVGNGSCAQRY
jgi:Phosphate-induced protein 1 conserved region